MDFDTVPQVSDLVFPGDANHDQIANNTDFLQLGVFYGQTGPTRPNATLNWEGQWAMDWDTTQANGYDIKHVDCDGNGTIDNDDGQAILLNYGLTHSSQRVRGGSTFNLQIELPDSPTAGQQIISPITLGTIDTPMTDIYGIAFSVTYDTNFIEPGSVQMTFDTCWIGTEGVDMMTMYYDHEGLGRTDIAITRIDQQNVSGHGQISAFTYVMNDDIIGKRSLSTTIDFEAIYAIDKHENVLDVGGIPSELQVITGIDGKTVFDPGIVIYPNPATAVVLSLIHI